MLGSFGALALLTSMRVALAQAPEASPDGDMASDNAELRSRIEAQQVELEAQRKELEAQRKELEAQRKELEAQREGLAALRDSADEPVSSEPLLGVEPFTERELLSVHGFIDTGVQWHLTREHSLFRLVSEPQVNSFLLGNINLMFDMEPSEDWRGFVEARLTNSPHGQETSYANPLGDPYERIDSRVNDQAGTTSSREIIAGHVVIERAWIDWTYRDWLQVRTGLWFTPWGIWNLDHGSPTLISLRVPLMIQFERVPLRQVGVQVHGRTYRDRWEIGYHGYISNGRTPGQFDVTHDKAFGGRFYASTLRGRMEVKLGLSAFYGHYADIGKTVVSYAPLTVVREQTAGYTEKSIGVDMALDIGALRLRSEAMLSRLVYDPGLRPPGRIPGTFLPDAWLWNAYALAAYRLPWYGLESYLFLDVAHRPSSAGDTPYVPSVGLNIHFSPEAQLKFQFSRVYYTNLVQDEPEDPNVNIFTVLSSRLVLAF